MTRTSFNKDWIVRPPAGPFPSGGVSYAVLDVAGMNYGDARCVMDRELFPNRIIVGTETFPTRIDANWKLVKEKPRHR